MSSSSPPSSSEPTQHPSKTSAKGNRDSDANIRNFAPVARIMKSALPENAKIAKEAKECMQECVSEFISFITSEGAFFLLLFSRKHASSNSFSVGEMPAGEAQDGQRRRHLVRNDFTGLRKLLGGVEDLSRSLSRGKHPSQIVTTPTRRHPEGSVEILPTGASSICVTESCLWPSTPRGFHSAYQRVLPCLSTPSKFHRFAVWIGNP